MAAGALSITSGNITDLRVLTTTNIPEVGDISAVVAGTGLTLTSTGDLNIQPTGNVVVNATYINGLANPQQDQDAATKYYVDSVATTGFAFHTAVLAATVGTLETATGGTITYAQPNGAANGVGATLTTTGT